MSVVATSDTDRITDSRASLAKLPLQCVDTLRGFASVWVMLYHAQGMFYRNHPSDVISMLFAGFGYLGVSLFFVISGFCIHLPYAAEKPLEVRSFAIRRFFRLYPAYFLAVLFCTAAEIAKGVVAGRPNPDITVANAIGHVFFWYHQAPVSVLGISPVFWSIAIEVHFYILYVICLPVLRRLGFGRCMIVALGLGLVYRYLYMSAGISLEGHFRSLSPDFFAPARFGEWLIGAWIAEVYTTRVTSNALTSRSPQDSKRYAYGIGIGIVVLIVSIGSNIAGSLSDGFLKVASAVAFGLLLWGLAHREANRRTGSVDSARIGILSRTGKWFGDRSYSLYLVHNTVIATFCTAYAVFVHQPKDAIHPGIRWLAVVLSGITVSCVLANLFYLLIEKPSHDFSRRLSNRWKQRRTKVTC